MYNANRLLLQFHITGKCNLRCKHCYRTEGDVEELSFDDVKNVIDQFLCLRERYNSVYSIKKRGHINITGGEPFIRSDIKEILCLLGEHKEEFSYGVLSNGSFIDDEIMSLLQETQVSFVQLSIDGNREIHDNLRTKGDYDRVFITAERLEKNSIRTYISFTANIDNFRYIPSVGKECRKRKITKLWSDRLVPVGNGQSLDCLSITDKELPDYINSLKKAQGNLLVRAFQHDTQVTMNRALQFIGSHGNVYSCSAGDSLITVDEFGRIMPCRRMPIICGDVFSSTLENVYFNDKIFSELRKRAVPKECGNCEYKYICSGGAKCQSYARYGSFYRADPACPLRKK